MTTPNFLDFEFLLLLFLTDIIFENLETCKMYFHHVGRIIFGSLSYTNITSVLSNWWIECRLGSYRTRLIQKFKIGLKLRFWNWIFISVILPEDLICMNFHIWTLLSRNFFSQGIFLCILFFVSCNIFSF